jgi:hypothetical protein
LHNEELHDLYSSLNVIRIMKYAWHVARMGEKRNAYSLLVGKPQGKRPPGRPSRKWIDNIEMDLLEIGLGGPIRDRIGWCGLEWSGSGEVRMESSCECGNEPSDSIK